MYPQETLQKVTTEIVSSAPPVVVFGIGIPGSGKSTLLKSVARELDTTPVDVDRHRNQILSLGWSAGAVDRLNHQVATEVSTHIVRGGVALIDSPNCHPEFREQDIALYRSLGARTIGAIWMDTPQEVAIARNSRRNSIARVSLQTITSMHASLSSQHPSTSEGFDWIIRLTDEEE